LEELRTGYLDLVLLIHWWPANHNSIDPLNAAQWVATWKVLEGFYKRDWIRAIGVSNFSEHHLEDLIHNSKIVAMVNIK
jgi:diketogulonate reductase-like aldo/keto reductase